MLYDFVSVEALIICLVKSKLAYTLYLDSRNKVKDFFKNTKVFQTVRI